MLSSFYHASHSVLEKIASARMLTANGSFDTHAVTLSNGKRNRSPKAGTPYPTASWPEVFDLAS